MGRSDNTDIQNPAQRFFDWNGAEGFVSYYDKDKKENVPVEIPFKFLILDRVSQVTGGIDRDGTYEGFWSNAVQNTTTQAFVVRSKHRVEAHGLWNDIKGTPGVKFMTGLYIAFFGENKELQIGYLRIRGAALNAWIEFSNRRSLYEGAFAITGKEKCKKGANVYYEPVFEAYPKVSEESEKAALALHADVLLPYLNAYFSRSIEPEVTQGEKAFTVNSRSVVDKDVAEFTGRSDDQPDDPFGTDGFDIPEEPEEVHIPF